MLEKFCFVIGGFFSGSTTVKIFEKDNRFYKNYQGDYNHIGEDYTEEISAEEVSVFEKRLSELGIYELKDQYFDDSVLDGTQWELKYKTKDAKCKKVSGSNAYPDCWTRLLSAIGVLVPEILE